jgi:ABC-type multidrug transport system permease subunit
MIIAGIETAETGGNIGQLLFSFSLIFCGVLATPQALPGFWIFMYRLSPFTYLVSGMLAAGLGRAKVKCSDIEILTFDPPANTTCQDYMAKYQELAGGTVLNPDATSACQFCSVADTDVFLQQVSVNYDDKWRNFGLLIVYIAFNIGMAYVFYWLARVPKKWGKKVEAK